eukprot:NODE_1753_length_747_cov_200.293548_g1704_i0.p1 GENE.NODE_1753_length_747_cov_200.293548_g1704_i0~~NODE_1753_length_747_cov_200.293548_g1704_i0.p1  ORF type:complete len:193 (+),score=41.30 NODE_1753_length_747_cov_200.293548_g1704_i0:82-660(+)
MKTVAASESTVIPEGVTIQVKNRKVTVTGPRGTLSRDFRHCNYEMSLSKQKGDNTFTCAVWFGQRRDIAACKSIRSHVRNMVIGVTKGFQYKMRFAYAHFPVNVSLDDNRVEIRNFLGEKFVRRVGIHDGVTATRTAPDKVKDEMVLEGNDIVLVSRTAADIHQSCLVKRKDIRKFLDGIYVSQKTTVVQDE